VIDIYKELKSFDMEVDVYDPWADAAEVLHEYGIEIVNGTTKENLNQYSAIILAVAHKEFMNWKLEKSPMQVLFDVKGVLSKGCADARL
jgi:UDP-N-acetyl-D-galactosamine dehydrogenase